MPKPIALEPCFGNKAAVLSIFIRLPRGPGGIPTPGQSGGGLIVSKSLNLLFTGSLLFCWACYTVTVNPFSPSFCVSGLAVASALVDVSQQLCVGYKEKSGGLRNRKQQPIAQPATCIWPLPFAPESWALTSARTKPRTHATHMAEVTYSQVEQGCSLTEVLKLPVHEIYPHGEGKLKNVGESCIDMERGGRREACLTSEWLTADRTTDSYLLCDI